VLGRWIPLCIAFAAMMTAALRVNQLFDRLKNEINAKAESKDHVPLFGWSHHNWGALGKHKRLYVQSDLRRSYYLWTAAATLFWLSMVFFLFSLVGTVGRSRVTASPQC
jgi:hypothetical protein